MKRRKTGRSKKEDMMKTEGSMKREMRKKGENNLIKVKMLKESLRKDLKKREEHQNR